MKKLFLLTALLLALSITPKTYAQDIAHSSATLAPKFAGSISRDDRVAALEKFLEKYNSPLKPYAGAYVKYADQYNVDWRLLPAISGVESTFGKFYIAGTYNAYGWGSGIIYFKSWEDGIQTINKTLREKYMDHWGAQNVWEIAPIYAESKTWAPRVALFMGQISDEYISLTSEKLTINL